MVDRHDRRRPFGLLARGVARLLADQARAQRLAEAFGTFQKHRNKVAQLPADALHALSFASQSDFKDLSLGVARLRRRARRLAETLERLNVIAG